MFVAMNKRGKRISLLESFSLKELQEMKGSEHFYCQSCGEEVIMKLGQSVAWHFAHKAAGDCPNQHEPETRTHLTGKSKLYHWLKTNGVKAEVEYYLPAIQRRPDLYLPERVPPLAIEFQCATIGYEQLKARSDSLAAEGIRVCWLFGSHRLKKLAPNLFKLSAMELATLQEMATHSERTYFLRYFSPTKKLFCFLQLLFPLTSTQFIGIEHSQPDSHINLKEFLTPSFHSPVYLSWKRHWLRQKKHWRTKVLPKFSPLERYLFTICARRRHVFSSYPAYIGLPIASSIAIATPPYLWQMWIITHFVNRGKGAYFTLEEIERGFQKMVLQRYFQLHLMLRFQPIRQALTDYLLLLSRVGLITPLSGDSYRINQSIEWKNLDLETLLKKDQKLLDLLYAF
ncbi:competence protein [Pullulanibacillus camelliae]|uniref:Competence protein n=1 Tax=Pullulanibacillus camelliae TaxID=1707096 RepID=A0A8J2YKU6_9BACL|nr:competence protein CoiA family protein [Pullulanibacillus camelliae]GGE51257.1 competence protein [Pullulanibacillus camelliae]